MDGSVEQPETLVLEFGYSTSINYPRAVELARQYPQHSESGEGKAKRHRIVWSSGEIQSLLPLYRLVRTWKSIQFYLNGRAVWGDPFGTWSYCFENREQAPDPVSYCFTSTWHERKIHPFGCQRTGQLRFATDAEWLRFGYLEPDGAWVFDKARILHYVIHQLHRYRFCPALSRRWIEALLDVFPDRVNPRKEPDWIYQTKSRQLALTLSLSFEEVDEQDRWPEPDTIIGVGPRDDETAVYILKGIFALVQLKHGLATPPVIHG